MKETTSYIRNLPYTLVCLDGKREIFIGSTIEPVKVGECKFEDYTVTYTLIEQGERPLLVREEISIHSDYCGTSVYECTQLAEVRLSEEE